MSGWAAVASAFRAFGASVRESHFAGGCQLKDLIQSPFDSESGVNANLNTNLNINLTGNESSNAESNNPSDVHIHIPTLPYCTANITLPLVFILIILLRNLIFYKRDHREYEERIATKSLSTLQCAGMVTFLLMLSEFFRIQPECGTRFSLSFLLHVIFAGMIVIPPFHRAAGSRLFWVCFLIDRAVLFERSWAEAMEKRDGGGGYSSGYSEYSNTNHNVDVGANMPNTAMPNHSHVSNHLNDDPNPAPSPDQGADGGLVLVLITRGVGFLMAFSVCILTNCFGAWRGSRPNVMGQGEGLELKMTATDNTIVIKIY
jgi:hypothetical protein